MVLVIVIALSKITLVVSKPFTLIVAVTDEVLVIVVDYVITTFGARQAKRAVLASSASISVLVARIPNISFFYSYSFALASTLAA